MLCEITALFANIPFINHAFVHSANNVARDAEYTCETVDVIVREERSKLFLYGVLHAFILHVYALRTPRQYTVFVLTANCCFTRVQFPCFYCATACFSFPSSDAFSRLSKRPWLSPKCMFSSCNIRQYG